jgi:hypothetical protein
VAGGVGASWGEGWRKAKRRHGGSVSNRWEGGGKEKPRRVDGACGVDGMRLDHTGCDERGWTSVLASSVRFDAAFVDAEGSHYGVTALFL